jgi:hypothetical protein
MPGDDIVPDPDQVSTRAVTVHAGPEHVWPWLAQMGYRRGGLYSYDALDIAFGILDRPSAQAVLPQFQGLETGDVIPLRSGGNFYVHHATPDECLVIGPEDRTIPVSWATVLYPHGAGTRLVSRVRVDTRGMPGGRIASEALDLAAFIMVRRWLLNLKDRAETLARSRRPAGQRL